MACQAVSPALHISPRFPWLKGNQQEKSKQQRSEQWQNFLQEDELGKKLNTLSRAIKYFKSCQGISSRSDFGRC